MDQKFILSKDKQIDFEHTQAAIAHFAATCAPGNLGNLKFRNDVHALLKRNTSIAIDFSAMSPHQRITFSDVFEKGNKSGEFKIKNLKIEDTYFLPELKKLDHLRSLEISNSHIESLCPVAQLKSLESLTISCCPNLTVFPAMKNLSNTLVSLDINGCSTGLTHEIIQ